MNVRLATIGDYVEPVSSWNPTSRPTEAFIYIDLSAVSQSEKQVKSSVSLLGAEAPSRARQLIRADDILVSTVRPNLNGVAAVTDEFDGATASTGFCVLRPRPEKLSSRYLMHWVRSSQFVEQMTRQATGASYPAVTDRIVKGASIPLPPLDEQRRIAAILDKADALRRKRRQILNLLDALSQSIFMEMFGDPVANERGWPSSTLGDLDVAMTYGPRFYNEAYSDDGVRIVRITDLAENGELDFDAMPKLKVSDQDHELHRSRPGDLLFARTGATVGKMALITDQDPPTIPGAYFIRLRFQKKVVPLFAWFVLRSKQIQQIVLEGSRQSAQQNFSGPGLRRLPMILPDISTQAAFVEKIHLCVRLRRIQRGLAKMQSELFSSLQHRAFSGQL